MLLKATNESEFKYLVDKLLSDVQQEKKTDIYIKPKIFSYVYKCQDIISAQPMVIDFIEAKSNIYDEYVKIMMLRMKLYPNLSYNFKTKNSALEISIFLKKFPFFQDKVNIIKQTREVDFVFKRIKQYPYTLLTNERNKLIYEGSVNLSNYSHELQYLDLICQKINQYYVKQVKKEEKSKNITPDQLGTLLGGMCNKQQNRVRWLPTQNQGTYAEKCYLSPVYKQQSRAVSACSSRNHIDLNFSKDLIRQEAQAFKIAPPKFLKNFVHHIIFEERKKGNICMIDIDRIQ